MFARSLIPALLLGVVTPAFAEGHAYAYGHRAPAPTGVVQVVNRSGTAVTVTVDGQASRMVGPNQVANLSVVAGEVRVRATFRLFGQELPLETVRTYVTPGRTTPAVLSAPSTARVLVSNSTPVVASVRADGREVATLAPGQERLLALPARATTISLYADGHLVRTQRLEMRPFDEPRLRVEMPTRGDLVVQNPLPIPIQLVCDRGMVRTLEPYGRTEYEGLPLGTFHLTAKRLTGEVIDDNYNRVDAWTETTWRVDPPNNGLVIVDNDHWLSARVYVDGRVTTTLAPDADTRLVLALGWHHLEVRDETGREIEDTWIEVERYEDVRVDVGQRRGPPPADGRHDRHDDDGYADAHGHEHDDRYDDHEPAAGCTVPSR